MAQGSHGICYAYAGAGMADAWQRNQLSRPRTADALAALRPTSPAALAASTRAYARRSGATRTCSVGPGAACGWDDGLNGGNIEDTINFLRQPEPNGRACDHRQVFGVSEISYEYSRWEEDPTFASADPDPFLPPFMRRVRTTHARSGLGVGGTFSTGFASSASSSETDLYIPGRDSQYLTVLNEAWDEYQRRLREPLADATAIARAMSTRLEACLLEANVPDSLIPGDTVDGTNAVLRDIFSGTRTGTRVDFLARYFQNACQGQTFRISPTMPIPVVTDYRVSTGRHNETTMLNEIHTALERRNGMPVAISFCATALRNPSGVTLASTAIPGGHTGTAGGTSDGGTTQCQEASGGVATTPVEADGSDHVTLLIGRKQVGTRCMLLMRNSWGVSCERYLPDAGFECDEATGDFWVDESVLARVTYETIRMP
ncbi:MAG: hypothetical protein IT285_14035 [Bdellovibrionales bacterium]|nr:hypothetical protein [Bdellovibrionales bacterium]